MITKKTEKDIKLLREGGKHLCEILDKLEKAIVPGVELCEINDLATKLTKEYGDEPILLGYHPPFAPRPYPATLCMSINDEIVHGIPNENNRPLKEGDIVGIDMSIAHGGLITDSARTVSVGKISKKAQKLIDVTREARARGIKAAKGGNHIGDIGHAIESFVRPLGYGVVERLCGHGVGYKVHEEPNVPNYGKPGTGPLLEPGMVLAIEPMINEGSAEIIDDPDGYTIRTADGKLSAHFEHTVLITEDDAEILTEC